MSHYELRDSEGRFVGRSRGSVAAHRATRRDGHVGSSVNMAGKKERVPSLVDRGYGIGSHGWNNMFRGADVRQIIVYDVYGEGGIRYDLDRMICLDMRGQPITSPRWTWEQVKEVVTKDLAPYDKVFGDPYGDVRESTLYGLYYGRRPKWMEKSRWESRKVLGVT